MVGMPRFSPFGIIVPLSGRGSGFDPRRHTEFRCCATLGEKLVVGAMDEEGFRLWASHNGEQWEPLAEADFSTIYHVEKCQVIPVADELVLVLDTTDLDGAAETQIWAGKL